MDQKPFRVAVVNSHPIQYFAPLYAYLNRDPALEVTALYCSDISLRGGMDPGFGQAVKWDVDLLAGYPSIFLDPSARQRVPGGFWSLVCPEVWSEVRSGKYDAVWLHGYAYAADLIALAAAKSRGLKVFYRSETHLNLRRSGWKRRIRDGVLSIGARFIDRFLAIGTANRDYYRALGVPERKIVDVPYTVDNDRFIAAARLSDDERVEVHRKFGLAPDRPVVLFASKLTTRKHPDDVVRAIARLRDEGVMASLLFVGAGEMEASLRSLVVEYNLSGLVSFGGFVNQAELPRVYAASDVFVLPAENEPWGLIVNEVMCAGVPVIVASEAGCVPDLVHDGRNGLLMQAGDVASLTAALRRLLVDDRERAAMGQKGLEMIRDWSYERCGAASWPRRRAVMLNDEVSPDPGMIDRFRQWIIEASKSQFRQNAIWFTALTGFERALALVQTALIANALGKTEYGVYGLLFVYIGYIASNAGFQLGLTATVFVSRYRETEKAKAAGVIAVVSRFGWLSALVIVAMALPFSGTITEALLGASRYQAAVMLGILFVGVTVVSGIQDGVAQGFEMFVVMAQLKIAVAALVLASIYPVAREFGLSGVLSAILVGAVLKCLLLEHAIWKRRAETNIPKRGTEVSLSTLVADFALPSVAVSLVVGFVPSVGLWFMSRPADGFDEVAIITLATMWRLPVLLLTTALGGVAVPAFGRLAGTGDNRGSRRLRRILSLVNFSISSAASLVLVALSGVIISIWFPGIATGRLAFCLMVLSTVPSVVANVYLQELVGSARMWRQFWLHGPYVIALSISFFFLVPRYQAMGYAASVLIGSVVLLAHVVAADAMAARREPAGAGA